MVDAMERPPSADHGVANSTEWRQRHSCTAEASIMYRGDPNRSSDTSLPIALARLGNPLSFTHSTKVFVIIGMGRSDGLHKSRRVVTGKDRGSSNSSLKGSHPARGTSEVVKGSLS